MAERELQARLRPFARFHDADAHSALVDGLLLERRLRDRIAQLKGLMRAGVRSAAEAEALKAEERGSAEVCLIAKILFEGIISCKN